MMFVDTNYFLRFLLSDQGAQHKTATQLFAQAASGEVRLFTSLVVFLEIYWVLSSFYQKNKKELIEKLEGVLGMSFIEIQDREILESAVRVYKDTTLDLEDAYNLVFAAFHGASELKTFDKQLDKIFSR
jgi:predicted nucleic-acid-binding protein